MGEEGGPRFQLVHIADDQIQEESHKGAAVGPEFRKDVVSSLKEVIGDLHWLDGVFHVVDDVLGEASAVARHLLLTSGHHPLRLRIAHSGCVSFGLLLLLLLLLLLPVERLYQHSPLELFNPFHNPRNDPNNDPGNDPGNDSGKESGRVWREREDVGGWMELRSAMASGIEALNSGGFKSM